MNKDGKGGHHGCDDVEQVRAARNAKHNTVRNRYIAQEKNRASVDTNTEAWIDWTSSRQPSSRRSRR